MKANAWGSLPLLFLVAACGNSKPAEEPQNTEDNASESSSATPAASDAPPAPEGPAAPSAGKPVGGDDSSKEPAACGGFEVPDLRSVISQASCEAPDTKAMNEQKDVKNILDIKMAVDSPLIAPGASAQVTITYQNKGKTDLPLYFVVDPEPRFEFEAYTLKGSRADNPGTPAPPLPSEVANATAPEQKVAKITLASLGTAKLTLKWDAVKYKWASKDRAKGALPGHGYPREPAGPLKKGKYVLRAVTPLVGVFEGSDHEVSQPRVQVTLGGR